MQVRTEQRGLQPASHQANTKSSPEKLIWPVQLSRPLVLGGIWLAVMVVVGVYVITSARTFRIGYPLDDAWIHQTYARNLALHGEWAFIPGRPSAGSTSPLW